MNIFDEVANWEKTEGASVFSSIINASDPVILDYGCGAGNYSFAAAYAFDRKCKIYAVDINRQCLDHINDKATKENIDCITTAVGKEDYRHDFDDDTFDLIIYADMFHGEEKIYGGLHRFVMIEEAKRTLKKNGILAVLPFHLSNFRDKNKKKCKYTYKKLIDEICSYGFSYTGKDPEGIHFEKVYSPYYQQKGGVTFDSLERGKMLIFELAEDVIKELDMDEMESVVGGTGASPDASLLQALVDVCKFDIGSANLSVLATNSKRDAMEYVKQNALPYMRNRCPGYSDDSLRSFIDSYALKAINAVI